MIQDADVLLVEDKEDDRQLVERTLHAMGMNVTSTTDGQRAMVQLRETPFRLIIADLDLQGSVDGLRIAEASKWRWPKTAVILTTEGNSLESAVTAIDLGVDGYLLKPLEEDNLQKTVKQALERQENRCCVEEERSLLKWRGLSLDTESHQAAVDGESVHLTPTEFRVLRFLMRNAHRVVRKQELVEVVYPRGNGKDGAKALEALRWHVYNLRQKIEPEPTHPIYIRTEHGVGYTLGEPDAA